MSQTNLELKLKKSLEELNSAAESVVKTRGYTKEVQSIRMLKELIKEQLTNENTRHSTSKTR